ncbi:hypothetical protein C8Q77DRAFT_703148 [Trametes polyzona]|nr:hypothetical protein C8Q77DRAFT_703148 [Trametes polyzona]
MDTQRGTSGGFGSGGDASSAGGLSLDGINQLVIYTLGRIQAEAKPEDMVMTQSSGLPSLASSHCSSLESSQCVTPSDLDYRTWQSSSCPSPPQASLAGTLVCRSQEEMMATYSGQGVEFDEAQAWALGYNPANWVPGGGFVPDQLPPLGLPSASALAHWAMALHPRIGGPFPVNQFITVELDNGMLAMVGTLVSCGYPGCQFVCPTDKMVEHYKGHLSAAADLPKVVCSWGGCTEEISLKGSLKKHLEVRHILNGCLHCPKCHTKFRKCDTTGWTEHSVPKCFQTHQLGNGIVAARQREGCKLWCGARRELWELTVKVNTTALSSRCGAVLGLREDMPVGVNTYILPPWRQPVAWPPAPW